MMLRAVQAGLCAAGIGMGILRSGPAIVFIGEEKQNKRARKRRMNEVI